MPIRVPCPSCGHVLSAPDAAAGKRGKCPKCGTSVPIPSVPPAPPPPPPARVVKAVPVAPPKPRQETFDVEVEDDAPPPPKKAARANTFDVEIEDESPPRPAPTPPAPARDPFAGFGPPPDSAAAKLKRGVSFDVTDPEPTEAREKLHPGWRDVATGLDALKRSAQVSVLFFVMLALASALGVGSQPLVGLLVAGIGLLFGLGSVVFLVIGLLKCKRMPADEDGGAGQQLAHWSFVLTLVGVVCGLAYLVVPFLLGVFLRRIGDALGAPPAAQAAKRYLFAAGAAVAVGVVSPIVTAVGAPVAISVAGDPGAGLVVVILAAVVSLAVNLLALMLYLGALSAAEAAINTAIRQRGLGQPPKKRRRRDEDDEDDDDRPAKKPRPASGDDYNPFA